MEPDKTDDQLAREIIAGSTLVARLANQLVARDKSLFEAVAIRSAVVALHEAGDDYRRRYLDALVREFGDEILEVMTGPVGEVRA